MRAILLSLAALGAAVAFVPSPASAQTGPIYPWCAQYGGRSGATNCYFANLWQCQQAISGNGGWCYRNPFSAQASEPRDRRRTRQDYRPY
ncbi:hypothetical protein CCR97_10425 [Rhodoplanes elegans]|uniref:DUF3551 domain-containing protein n=1 Tax=Rhodoplanes elegans TaxID=29408 RepID=A0A327K0L5_9BRAD|nr:DUF3551 domain-containing protein [Rhodoplanes elegans]MBK5958621.1 hypothetical protein [Rhodoplanes elegans]RAI32270.1 hypothetical protein CH338_24475 [Rhodoplanes elegans]